MTFKPIPELAAMGEASRGVNAAQESLALFLYGKTEDERFAGARNAIFLLWPEFIQSATYDPVKGPRWVTTNKWNPWLERNLRAFVNEKHAVRRGESVFRSVVLTGCAGAGKTHSAGLFACLWWMADPKRSIAILTSTTKDMIRNRIWPVITHYWSSCYYLVNGEKIEIGHMVDSQMKLMAEKGNAKNSISAYAVAHGETQKAIHNLKGMHAPRMLLIIDEANGTPEAIFEIIGNYRKACQDLTVVIIGNPSGRGDPHGRALTPEDGWGSMNEDTIQWKTAGVPEWQLDPGIAMRFDGRDSPNVKIGCNRYPYIYTLDDWNNAHSNADYLHTMNYWVMDRGMHPPEGFSNTVFTEQLFIRCQKEQHFTYSSESEGIAFLDSGFGGDACMLRVGTLGDVGGVKKIQLTESFEIPIDPNTAEHDIDYQIARRVIQEMTVRRIKPHCFGLDATGIGRGVGAIIAAEWSPQIQYLNWGVGATERPSAQNDGRPSREVYNNFVCEMWFSTREVLEAEQITGFTREEINQFCSRTYEMSGKKYKLEPKPDYKQRMRRSCDDADACIGLVEVARRNGLDIQGKISQVTSTVWREQVKKAQDESALEDSDIVKGGWATEDLEGVYV